MIRIIAGGMFSWCSAPLASTAVVSCCDNVHVCSDVTIASRFLLTRLASSVVIRDVLPFLGPMLQAISP